MAYRNTRGNNATNSPNTNLYNRRYSNRRNDTTQEGYNQPVYSTQAGYQNNQNQQQTYTSGFNNKGQAPATTVKQEAESPVKREEYQAPAAAAKPAQPSTPAQEQTPADTAAMVQDDDDDTKQEKPWKKKTFQKLPKKIRKKRLNAKLRNLLAPKNAMMVLHELHPGLSCVSNEDSNNTGQISYSVVIEIDGKQFKGQGLSKVQAKQVACENALKAALLEKMAQSNIKTENLPHFGLLDTSSEVQAMETTESEAADTNGEGAGGEGKKRKPPEEDDVPWGSLASYALFKLFSEWHAQGYNLPTSPGKAVPVSNTMMPMKKMPPDASQRHPVQLLNQLKPGCQYSESREGNPPNMVFSFTVGFDGQNFVGTGPSKKDAKKACAKNALISLGVQYED